MTRGGQTFHVAQGECKVSDAEDAMITTVLGSCVSACLWDPQRGIGGMNHILLPEAGAEPRLGASFAVNAMELLVNALLRGGADKRRLQAKLFGGASMISGLGDIGRRNAEVARAFLDREQIPCVSESIGGTRGRRVQFWPVTGRVRQMLIADLREVQERPVPMAASGSDLELF